MKKNISINEIFEKDRLGSSGMKIIADRIVRSNEKEFV